MKEEEEAKELCLDSQSHASSSVASSYDDMSWQWPTSFWTQFKVRINPVNINTSRELTSSEGISLSCRSSKVFSLEPYLTLLCRIGVLVSSLLESRVRTYIITIYNKDTISLQVIGKGCKYKNK